MTSKIPYAICYESETGPQYFKGFDPSPDGKICADVGTLSSFSYIFNSFDEAKDTIKVLNSKYSSINGRFEWKIVVLSPALNSIIGTVWTSTDI